jgi:uncharacterized Zn finger protein
MESMQLDLFDFAQSRAGLAAPSPESDWEETGDTLWGRAWQANVRRICTPKYTSEMAFGERLLQAGRLQSCRVRRAHAQASFTNREGGTALVNLSVKPLTPERWLRLDRLCERCGDALFSSDELPDDIVAGLFGLPDGLLPELSDLTFSCSHCRNPFCLYRAATLLAMAAEFDRKPIKLLELRGATGDLLFMRSAQQAGDGHERIAEEDLSELFGIDLE